MISKEILIQYSDLQEEVKEVRERIDKTEKQIAKMRGMLLILSAVGMVVFNILRLKVSRIRNIAERKRFYMRVKPHLQALKWNSWRP